MNAKAIVVGALVFWLVTNLLGMFVTGFFIHSMILKPTYQATQSFWLPALNQDPPDMAALLPSWLMVSLVSSFVVAGIYSCARSSCKGPGWKRGLTWGLSLGIFIFVHTFSMSGIFNLPLSLFVWWGIDGLILFIPAGVAMGWATEKFAGA